VDNSAFPIFENIMVKVQIFIDSQLVREHEFKAGERELYIGRRASHPIHLDDIAVSGDHARLTLGSAVVVEDLKSTNGTLLNGAAISRPTPLNPSDTIQIAKFHLRIADQRNNVAAETPTIIVEPRTIPLHGKNATLEKTGFYSYAEYRKQIEEGPQE